MLLFGIAISIRMKKIPSRAKVPTTILLNVFICIIFKK